MREKCLLVANSTQTRSSELDCFFPSFSINQQPTLCSVLRLRRRSCSHKRRCVAVNCTNAFAPRLLVSINHSDVVVPTSPVLFTFAPFLKCVNVNAAVQIALQLLWAGGTSSSIRQNTKSHWLVLWAMFLQRKLFVRSS